MPDNKPPGRNVMKERILPGLWIDMDGNPHFSVPDILKEMGLPDTPENRLAAREACAELAREAGLEVRVRHTPED